MVYAKNPEPQARENQGLANCENCGRPQAAAAEPKAKNYTHHQGVTSRQGAALGRNGHTESHVEL